MSHNTAFLEPITRSFVNAVNSNTSAPPLYTLPPADARKALEDLQSSDNSLTDSHVAARTLTTPTGVRVVLFTPKSHTRGKLPIVLYTHGGGWILGSPHTHARLVRSLVTATDYAFAFVYYDNAPEGTWDIVTKQTYDSLKWIVSTADQHGLDASRVAVAGDSAGGNLAIANTIQSIRHGNKPVVKAAALLYPVTNISVNPSHPWNSTESMRQNGKGLWLEEKVLDWMYDAYAPNGDDRDNILVSPVLARKKELVGFPPTLIVTVENDPLRDEGENFARNLADAGVNVFSTRVGQTIHDFMLLNPVMDSPAVNGTLGLLAGFLRGHLGA